MKTIINGFFRIFGAFFGSVGGVYVVYKGTFGIDGCRKKLGEEV